MLETIIQYFSEIPSVHRTAILVGGLVFFSLIESALPLMSLDYKRWKHAGTNIFFTLTTIIVNFILAFILVKVSDWVVAYEFGIIGWMQMPLFAQLIIGLLLMDLLGAYLAHWVQHHIKWMWRFHAIHHTDQHIDVTSANRHHPGESVIRFVFTILATLVVGAPIWLVMLYQSASVVLSQFNHSNLVLPRWLDKIMVYFICTPNMHHVHHHYRMPYSDTNYGNIFSFWDRLFRTYVEVDNSKLIYGLDTHMDKKEVESVVGLLGLPFDSYRPHIEYTEQEQLD
jgi:sterol desaturase/sphingolipid hydroxylase (fatty acid hydroxylase superfamily)